KIHGNNKKVEFEKKKDLIKGKLIKDVRKEFAKSIVSGEEKIKKKYKNFILKFDRLGATCKFRVPGVERAKKITTNNRNHVEWTGKQQELVNDNADNEGNYGKGALDFLDIQDLLEAFKSLREIQDSYYDIDPEDKVYIQYEKYGENEEENKNIPNKKNEYTEIKKQICEEKQHEVISFFRAEHMRINPSRGQYDIAPDDFLKGKKERRGILRRFSDTGFVTIQSFSTESEFNINGKPLNATLEYFRQINFDLHAETIKRMEKGEESFKNIGKKEAKKYNKEIFSKTFYGERETLNSNEKFIDKNIVLDFVDSDKQNVLILQGRTSIGKSSLCFEIAKRKDICNIVIVPFVVIKKGKYDAYYKDTTTDKVKLMTELAKLGINDKEERQAIENAYVEGRIKVYCPEGYVNDKPLSEMIEENEEKGLKTILTADEAHSFLGKVKFRPNYADLLYDMTECTQRYGLKLILLSATIDKFTYHFLKEKAKLRKDQTKWINFVPKGQEPLKSNVTYVAHNNDPQEIINLMVDFYNEQIKLPEEERGNCGIAISNVEFLIALKKLFNDDWGIIEGDVGIDLFHAEAFKARNISSISQRERELYKLLEKTPHKQELLDKILNKTKEEIDSDTEEEDYTYLTETQYDLIQNMKLKKDKKGKFISPQYILAYIQRKFIKTFKGKHIDNLIYKNELTSMFSFFTSSGFEGIDIYDNQVKKVIFVCNNITHDEELIRQFFGRFRLQLQNNNFVFEVIIPNAKSNRRVQTLNSIDKNFFDLVKADGAMSMCKYDNVYEGMVKKGRVSTIISISEMIKKVKMGYIKNHFLIKDYLACHDIEVTKIEVKNNEYYEQFADTEKRQMKLIYNQNRRFQRNFKIQDVLKYNNNVINWLKGNKSEVPKNLHFSFARAFGNVCEFTKKHDGQGYICNTIRIRNFISKTVDYILKLNLANIKFDAKDYIYLTKEIALNFGKQKLLLLKEHVREATDLMIKEKSGIEGENEEDLTKKQKSKSYEIKQKVTSKLKSDIKNILLEIDKNGKRVFMFDVTGFLIDKIFKNMFYIDYKNEVIISFLDLENGYYTSEKAIKGIYKHDLKTKNKKDILTASRDCMFSEAENIEIFKRKAEDVYPEMCKVSRRGEFKGTLNNYNLAVLTKYLNLEAKKATGKSFCFTNFEKQTIKKRRLQHGSHHRNHDCIIAKHDYIVLNFIDTLKNGKTRLIAVPFNIKTIKAMLLESSNTSPPLGIDQ
ncbi:MAG: hypothetical protein OEZ28_03835, partial [Nitrospinota bacterium]|nr:hypothetical protein [Nitrospinota bacterium]